MKITIDKTLRRYLDGMGVRRVPRGLKWADVETERIHAATQHPEESHEEHRARAIARVAHRMGTKSMGSSLKRFVSDRRVLWVMIAVLVLLLLDAEFGHSQETRVRGAFKGTTASATVTATSADANHTGLDVNCVAGCSAAPGASSVTVNDPTVTTQKLAVDAAGKIGINNFPASQPVTGTFWQATQPVSGTFWQATQPVSGTVSVSNFPATQPVSGTFWQATQPVSGTFWQATQPVSGAVTVAPSTDTAAGGLTATSKATVTSSVSVKTSAGLLYGVFVMNGAVATCWLELINSASAGTLGTAVIMNIPMASAGLQYLQFSPPIGGFTSGIAVGSASAVGGASACGTAVTGVTVIYK